MRARPEFLNEVGMIFGAHYESAAIVPDGTALPEVANPITDHLPVARPGSRAPHVWLERDGGRRSTVDLFARRFVLLAGGDGKAWRDAGLTVAAELGVPLEAFTIGPGGDLCDAGESWTDAYGVEDDGAVLVRPDAHVGWRGRSFQMVASDGGAPAPIPIIEGLGSPLGAAHLTLPRPAAPPAVADPAAVLARVLRRILGRA
jgi:hypothetical protein